MKIKTLISFIALVLLSISLGVAIYRTYIEKKEIPEETKEALEKLYSQSPRPKPDPSEYFYIQLDESSGSSLIRPKGLE